VGIYSELNMNKGCIHISNKSRVYLFKREAVSKENGSTAISPHVFRKDIGEGYASSLLL